MKNITVLLVLLIGIKTLLSAGAGYDLPERHFYHFSKYNFGSIDSINENIFTYAPGSETRNNNTRITYLQNGLFTVDYVRFNRRGKILYYNEKYNDNIISQNKTNENIEIMFEFYDLINVDENTIEIDGNFILERVTMKFDDTSRRLNSIENHYDKHFGIDYPNTETLYYEYDYSGKLTNVYTFYNGNKIIRKAVFYDGNLRLIDNNFFVDWGIRNTEEIVIYENNRLKYHLAVRKHNGDMITPGTIDQLNRQYYFVIFEYDENGNEIKQTKYNNYRSNELIAGTVYYVDNLTTDENKNWIKRLIYHYQNGNKLIIQEIDRIIEYKQLTLY